MLALLVLGIKASEDASQLLHAAVDRADYIFQSIQSQFWNGTIPESPIDNGLNTLDPLFVNYVVQSPSQVINVYLGFPSTGFLLAGRNGGSYLVGFVNATQVIYLKANVTTAYYRDMTTAYRSSSYYNTTLRSWYRTCSLARTSAFTDIYPFASGDMGVTKCFPIWNDTSRTLLSGVAGVDFDFQLSDAMTSVSSVTDMGGVAFLMEDDGDLIASSNWNVEINAARNRGASIPFASSAVSDLIRGAGDLWASQGSLYKSSMFATNSAVVVTLRGTTFTATFSSLDPPILGLNWTFVTVVPDVNSMTAGEIAGIAIGSLLLLLGVAFCFRYWFHKRAKMNQSATKIKSESRPLPDLSKDPRKVALDGTVKICEQTLKQPKLSEQNKLFLKSVIAGTKDSLSHLVSHAGIEMTAIKTEPQKQGSNVFNMEDFEHVKFLSQGQGGTAELYTEKATNQQVVIKVPFVVEELDAEAKVWCSIGVHPNVARMIGTVNLKGKPRGIVMEYYPGGSLDTTAQEFSSNELLRITTGLARGLQCLHEHKVIHRDLAARNVLVASDRRVAITDFGLSRQLDENDAYRMVNERKLPWRTLAPELLLLEDGARVFSEKTDIWALGVTIWELATKQSAYADAEERDFHALQQKIGKGVVKLDLTPIIMNHEHLAAALVGCFNRDPALRPNAEQLRWLLKDENSAEVKDRANYIATLQGQEYE